MVSPVTTPKPAPVQPRRPTWGEWQHSRVSQRLLSEKDRREGYTVVQVPRSLRQPFLDVAHIFWLYKHLIHDVPGRQLSAKQLACLQAWAEATYGVITVLQEAADG